MENLPTESQEATVNSLYNYAAQLLIVQKKESYEVKNALIEQGLSEENARTIVNNLESQIDDAHREKAKKDMLYGALWCIGGTVLTLANIGFIFWGAIIFGGIQFFSGLINYNKV